MWTDIWMFTRKYSAIKKVVAKSSFIHSHVETVTKKKSHLHLNFWIFCSIFCWISLFVKMKEWDWKYHSLSNQTIQLGHFSFSELIICVKPSLWLLCKYIHLEMKTGIVFYSYGITLYIMMMSFEEWVVSWYLPGYKEKWGKEWKNFKFPVLLA